MFFTVWTMNPNGDAWLLLVSPISPTGQPIKRRVVFYNGRRFMVWQICKQKVAEIYIEVDSLDKFCNK